MSGYVLDDLALTAGLAGGGSERHRREFSRLVSGAIDGGPAINLPALCLAAVTALRPAVIGHLAELIAHAPAGVISIGSFTRTDRLGALRALETRLPWPALHAADHAVATSAFLITTDTRRYDGVPAAVIPL